MDSERHTQLSTVHEEQMLLSMTSVDRSKVKVNLTRYDH